MKFQSIFNKKGITLIELLVALVISAIVLAGVYRIFISQSKAYTIQDEVVEVQQSVRSAMEILSRDIRMTGFDDDNLNSKYTAGALSGKPMKVLNPIGTPLSDYSLTVTYEYFDRTVGASGEYQLHTVAYKVDGSNLVRTRTVTRPNGSTQTEPQESLLPNVTELRFTYGVDDNDDDVVDRWVLAASAVGERMIAVRVELTATPNQTNPDVQRAVSPRKLDSILMMRNMCIKQ